MKDDDKTLYVAVGATIAGFLGFLFWKKSHGPAKEASHRPKAVAQARAPRASVPVAESVQTAAQGAGNGIAQGASKAIDLIKGVFASKNAPASAPSGYMVPIQSAIDAAAPGYMAPLQGVIDAIPIVSGDDPAHAEVTVVSEP